MSCLTSTATNVDSINGATREARRRKCARSLPRLPGHAAAVDGGSDLRDVAADVVAVVRADATSDDVRADLRDVAADADARHAGADRLELVRYVLEPVDPEDCPADGDLVTATLLPAANARRRRVRDDGGQDNCGGGFDIRIVRSWHSRRRCQLFPVDDSHCYARADDDAATDIDSDARSPACLVGGSTEYEGRVEILHDGAWGTVCDDGWGMADADVVCRQLFGSSALSAPCCAAFGRGSDPIWMDEISCVGDESHLRDCPFNGWGSHDCHTRRRRRVRRDPRTDGQLSAVSAPDDSCADDYTGTNDSLPLGRVDGTVLTHSGRTLPVAAAVV